MSNKIVPTYDFVERLIRIFTKRPNDDYSALVLIDYAEACQAALSTRSAGLTEDEASLLELCEAKLRNGFTGEEIGRDQLAMFCAALRRLAPQAPTAKENQSE